ncbi:uncharacterized protein LOC133756392 [Lepus europaeus]|uniref:uncharacterized protein LOC133756392 n=1 Tax=Lepus europaeus TaxID=9983 RepID=UPI002B4631D2|nr:uncharacterized protein LOC133756392 [Lepus europaeus]
MPQVLPHGPFLLGGAVGAAFCSESECLNAARCLRWRPFPSARLGAAAADGVSLFPIPCLLPLCSCDITRDTLRAHTKELSTHPSESPSSSPRTPCVVEADVCCLFRRSACLVFQAHQPPLAGRTLSHCQLRQWKHSCLHCSVSADSNLFRGHLPDATLPSDKVGSPSAAPFFLASFRPSRLPAGAVAASWSTKFFEAQITTLNNFRSCSDGMKKNGILHTSHCWRKSKLSPQTRHEVPVPCTSPWPSNVPSVFQSISGTKDGLQQPLEATITCVIGEHEIP